MELTRLIAALADPAAYPEPVEEVDVRQTHISVVFLAGLNLVRNRRGPPSPVTPPWPAMSRPLPRPAARLPAP